MGVRRSAAERAEGWLRAAACFNGSSARPGEPLALETVPGVGLALALLDGTGCWSCGLEQSRPAAQVLVKHLVSGGASAMEAAFDAADAALTDVDAGDDLEGAPTASAAWALATPERLHLGWIGDCLPFLVRGGEVVWRGAPHTLGEEMRRKQVAIPEGAQVPESVLLRGMGAHPRGAPALNRPELAELRAWPGDRLLLVNRLAGEALKPEDMVRALAEAGAEPGRAASALVDLALSRPTERHPELERAVVVLALLPG